MQIEVPPTEFVCAICRETKPADAFYKDRSRKWGIGHDCKTCSSIKTNRNAAIRRAERREERLAARRSNGAGLPLSESTERRILAMKSAPCAECGLTFLPVCMDFDHRPGTDKKFNVSQWRGHSAFEIVEEIAKCDIVCANCHRIRTFVQRAGGRPSKIEARITDADE